MQRFGLKPEALLFFLSLQTKRAMNGIQYVTKETLEQMKEDLQK